MRLAVDVIDGERNPSCFWWASGDPERSVVVGVGDDDYRVRGQDVSGAAAILQSLKTGRFSVLNDPLQVQEVLRKI